MAKICPSVFFWSCGFSFHMYSCYPLLAIFFNIQCNVCCMDLSWNLCPKPIVSMGLFLDLLLCNWSLCFCQFYNLDYCNFRVISWNHGVWVFECCVFKTVWKQFTPILFYKNFRIKFRIKWHKKILLGFWTNLYVQTYISIWGEMQYQ